jgi:trypsin-like peptidase
VTFRRLYMVFSLVIVVGCGRGNESQPAAAAPKAEADSLEEWTSKPPLEWPQIVLTNRAEFNGHTPLEGASAFLLKTRDGRTLAATAKHLLGSNGGVDPEVLVSKLNGTIRSWRMYPRTQSQQFILANKLGAEGLDAENLDWLILEIQAEGKALPTTPLRLRSAPVQVGEPVWLVGCPYNEPACKQGVYKGRVTNRRGDRFRYDIEPPVDLHGFSGAPILDKNGQVVGVMTVWFEPTMRGDKFLEAGGEDAASIFRLVEQVH